MARAEAMVSSARAWLFEVAGTSWLALAMGRSIAAADRRAIRLAALHATASSLQAAELLYNPAGISALFTSSALGRCVRDLHALTQNAAVSPARLGEVGRELLARPRTRRVPAR
jgi:hypothetical protein